MKKLMISLFALALFGTLTMSIAYAGNGAPSGAHYNLNIIGVPFGKKATMNDNLGHRIFVPLYGTSRILLCEAGLPGGECEDIEGFQVLDANGTDKDGAKFALPNPDPEILDPDNPAPENDGTTAYSVFARALGKPGGAASMTTCATDPSTQEEICELDTELTLELKRSTGKSAFENVSKYLLYIYVDLDGNGTIERYNLFNEKLQDYFWQYTNNGLKLAQLRFYPCATIVPDPTDPTGNQIDTDCFAK
jgi:hypothetical protein